MMLSFWSAKGGVGCSTAAAAFALLAANKRTSVRVPDVLLVDLGGDAPAILGIDAPPLGLADWLAEPYAAPDALSRIEVTITPHLHLLPLGSVGRLDARHPTPGQSVADPVVVKGNPGNDRQRLLFKLLASDERLVMVDVGLRTSGCGYGIHQLALLRQQAITYATDSILVTRLCYLGLKAMVEFETPNRVVVVAEPGRSLGAKDVERAVGAPVDATVRWDPAVARTVDAGILMTSMPRSLRQVSSLLTGVRR